MKLQVSPTLFEARMNLPYPAGHLPHGFISDAHAASLHQPGEKWKWSRLLHTRNLYTVGCEVNGVFLAARRFYGLRR